MESLDVDALLTPHLTALWAAVLRVADGGDASLARAVAQGLRDSTQEESGVALCVAAARGLAAPVALVLADTLRGDALVRTPVGSQRITPLMAACRGRSDAVFGAVFPRVWRTEQTFYKDIEVNDQSFARFKSLSGREIPKTKGGEAPTRSVIMTRQSVPDAPHLALDARGRGAVFYAFAAGWPEVVRELVTEDALYGPLRETATGDNLLHLAMRADDQLLWDALMLMIEMTNGKVCDVPETRHTTYWLQQRNLRGETPFDVRPARPQLRVSSSWNPAKPANVAAYSAALESGKQAGELSSMCQLDGIWAQMTREPTLCSQCGATATSRCSVCKIAGYCGQKCQKSAWSNHKKFCVARATGLVAASSTPYPHASHYGGWNGHGWD